MPAPSEPRIDVALPPFFKRLPMIDVGIAGVTARAFRGELLCVSFEFAEDVHVPEHHHGTQFGMVLSGELRVRRGGSEHRHRPGDRYLIASGEPHEAWIKTGTILIEFFEDADRY